MESSKDNAFKYVYSFILNKIQEIYDSRMAQARLLNALL